MTTGPAREYFYQKKEEEKIADSSGVDHEVRQIVELQQILAEFKGSKQVRDLLHKFEDVVFNDYGHLTAFLDNPKNRETAVKILEAVLEALEKFEVEVSAGTITKDMPPG